MISGPRRCQVRKTDCLSDTLLSLCADPVLSTRTRFPLRPYQVRRTVQRLFTGPRILSANNQFTQPESPKDGHCFCEFLPVSWQNFHRSPVLPARDRARTTPAGSRQVNNPNMSHKSPLRTLHPALRRAEPTGRLSPSFRARVTLFGRRKVGGQSTWCCRGRYSCRSRPQYKDLRGPPHARFYTNLLRSPPLYFDPLGAHITITTVLC